MQAIFSSGAIEISDSSTTKAASAKCFHLISWNSSKKPSQQKSNILADWWRFQNATSNKDKVEILKKPVLVVVSNPQSIYICKEIIDDRIQVWDW